MHRGGFTSYAGRELNGRLHRCTHGGASCTHWSRSARMQITIIPLWVVTVKHRCSLSKHTCEGERARLNTRVLTLQADQPWLKRSFFLLYTVKMNMLTTVSLHGASCGHPGQQWDLMTFRLHASAAQWGPLAPPGQHIKHSHIPRTLWKQDTFFSIQFKTLYVANTNENKLWIDFKRTDAS